MNVFKKIITTVGICILVCLGAYGALHVVAWTKHNMDVHYPPVKVIYVSITKTNYVYMAVDKKLVDSIVDTSAVWGWMACHNGHRSKEEMLSDMHAFLANLKATNAVIK